MNIEKIKQELMQASEGLQMLSETDATFEFYYHEKPEHEPFDEETVVEWDGKPGGSKVEVLSVEDFFRNMTNPPEGASAEQKQNADKFKQLQAKLHEVLKDVKAYKVSDQAMPVYLIGQTEQGDYAGLKTLVVET